ncbi:MAG: IgGFc-binding protein [Deltaproteobacteria bacterium]|nr:IgGFc-binding protein [Deltaproteobacteria bacterium]
MSTPNRLIFMMLLALVASAIAACSSPGGGGASGPGPDVSRPDGFQFGDSGPDPVACTEDDECPADRPRCGPQGCVACLGDGDCEGAARCVADRCVDSSCTTGEVICDGAVLLTCNAQGAWDTLPCPGECRDGACLGCAAGDRVCNGPSTVMRCKDDGSVYEAVETCDPGQTCGDGACLTCLPSQRRCTGAAMAETCNAQGEWEQTRDCASEGLSCLQGTCVSPCTRDPKAKSNSGCDYWAVDLDNHDGAQNGPYAVIVSNLSEQRASVKVSRKDNATAAAAEVLTREVEPGALQVLALPNRNMGGPGAFWTAYRVESSVPIIAYQFNPLDNVDVFSNDASLLLPTNTFGTEYIAVSRFELQGRDDSGGTIPYRGFLSIVASSTGTDVTIQPAARTQAGPNMQTMVPGQSYTYALEPYQVLNVKTDQDKADLTGSIITANKPIAVFSGHEAAVSSTTCCADHLEHQLFPVATWGTEYLATKAMARGVEPDYWRVVAAQDGTTVTFEPSSVSAPRTLDRGQWYELATQADFKVTADKPIMLAQTFASSGEVVSPFAYSECTDQEVCAPRYECTLIGDGFFDLTSLCFPPMCFGESDTSCPGGHTCTCYPSGACYCSALGDPTLVLVPPLKQFRNEYVFLTPDKYARDFINLIAPDGASVTLDGTLVPAANFKAIAGTGWRVARIEVGDGVHSVAATAAVGVITYGYDRDVSYGYAAGLNLVDE